MRNKHNFKCNISTQRYRVYSIYSLHCRKISSVKGRSHYSDNQSPTSDKHYFWGGCRRLSEVGKCLSMIGDWLSENYIDNLSPTSDNHPFSGWFSMVGKWLLMIAEQFWSARGFRCSINNHRQPNKAAIQNEYTKGLTNMKMMEK